MKVHRGHCFSCCMLRPIGKSLNQFSGLQTAFKKRKERKKIGQNTSVSTAQHERCKDPAKQLCSGCVGGCVRTGLCSKSGCKIHFLL